MEQAREVIELSLLKAQRIIEAHAQELGALDAAAGDGDHGTTMVRGMRAANQAVAELDGSVSPGMVLVAAGSAFSDAAGGASGALFGLVLQTSGQKLDAGPFDVASIHLALQAAAASVSKMGKAQVGDKTMLDALVPFVTTLGQATATKGVGLVNAWPDALIAGMEGAAATAGMLARRGRAARLGERSRDGLDPGAVSMCYLLQAVGEAMAEVCRPQTEPIR
jgi:dihydroxyacetone kinase phosphoprotein-dependent L subunit